MQQDAYAPSRDTDRALARRTLVVAIIVAAVGAVLLGAWTLRELLLLTFIAILLAILLDSVGAFIARWTGLGRGWATLAGGLGLVALLGGALVLFLPTLGEQVGDLIDRLPEAVAGLKQRANDFPWLVRLIERAQAGLGFDAVTGGDTGNVVKSAQSILSVASGIGGNLLFVIFAAAFLAASPATYRDGFVRLVPPARRAAARSLLDEMTTTLRAWLGGELLMMAIVGTLTGLGLWAIGVPLAFALGVLTGLFNIIPFIGPLLAAVPAILLAFAKSPEAALWTIALFVAVQQLEGNLILPLVQRQVVDSPPALVLFAVFAMATLFGLLGVPLATPTVAIALILVRRLYVENTLESPARVA